MRLMEIVSGTAVNGAVVSCLEVSRALAERGHSVSIVCRPNSWIARQTRNDSRLHVIECDLKRRHDRLGSIANFVRRHKVQIVHTHMSSANFFGVLLRRLYRVPCVVASAHNRNIQLHWPWNDVVLAVSQATRRYHHRVNFVPLRRFRVIHNFVDPDRHTRFSDADATRLREELGIPKTDQLIGVIGDIIPRKGQIHLVRAMPTILKSCPHAHLLCVGHWKDGFVQRFRKEASELGISDHVTWSPARDDIGCVLRTIDLFALPSLEENLPLTILEAMASRLPVVATSVGGIPECVVDGTTGRLVSPKDERQLADAVIDILKDRQLAAAMGTAGRERVVGQFSLDSQVKKIEQLFEELVAQKSKSDRPSLQRSNAPDQRGTTINKPSSLRQAG